MFFSCAYEEGILEEKFVPDILNLYCILINETVEVKAIITLQICRGNAMVCM